MSASTEEYLETLYKLTKAHATASTSAISKNLNIAPASVTEMLQKLAETGYVNYSPYQGVTLTPDGYRIAEKITRKHRILERFLHDVLKIKKDKVHQEACGLEHALSDETTRAMCRFLKVPDKCSDDDQSIPPCDLAFSSCAECGKKGQTDIDKIDKRKTNIIDVASLKEGQEGVISFIRGDGKTLARMTDMGLTPGSDVLVTRAASADGTMAVICRGLKLDIDRDITGNVFIDSPAG